MFEIPGRQQDEGDKFIDEAWDLIKDLVDKESLEALGLLEDKERECND